MPSKNYQLEKFNKEYARLNEYQKKAVDTIEGSVMVIAGPGTGKTQILSARIGKILLDIDSQSQNILCLIYHNEYGSENFGMHPHKQTLNSLYQ